MKIATFNVSSIKALPRVLEWLDDASPDVALLQELKTVDEQFPRLEIEERATTSRFTDRNPITASQSSRKTHRGCRTAYQATHPTNRRAILKAQSTGARCVDLFAERQSTPGEKFDYKLAWMTGLWRMSAIPCSHKKCPLFSAAITISVLLTTTCMTQSGSQMMRYADPGRAHGSEAINLGLISLAQPASRVGAYSYWDYQAGRWQRDEGVRIDRFSSAPKPPTN